MIRELVGAVADGLDVRAGARVVDGCASELRAQAQRLVAPGTVRWRSVAADRFRDDLEDRRAELVRTAEALDDAARALRRHADAVDAARGPAGWLP